MSDLAEFLLARIAEDERRLDLPDFIEEDSVRGPGWGSRGDCLVCGAYQFSGIESVTEEAWSEHAETVHQRRRVLAECEAKRRVVAEHGPWEVASLDRETRYQTFIVCRTCRRNERQVVAPCPTLRLLALPYADHPDYDEAWKPDGA